MTSLARRPPRVVACMPAWNSSAFIVPVLESIAAQTYPNLELLVSVDLSTDHTLEICERFAASHPNCRVLRQSKRLGWIANANDLIRTAEGKYLFFAFHDDPLHPTYVARLVEALENTPQAVLAFSDMETNRGPQSYPDLDGIADRVERVRRLLPAGGYWWVPNRGLMKADAVKALGGMRPHLLGHTSADWPWLMRLAAMGEFVRVPEALVSKVYRRESLSSTWTHGLCARMAVHLACLRVLWEAGFLLPQTLQLSRELLVLGLKQEWWRLDCSLRRRRRR